MSTQERMDWTAVLRATRLLVDRQARRLLVEVAALHLAGAAYPAAGEGRVEPTDREARQGRAARAARAEERGPRSRRWALHSVRRRGIAVLVRSSGRRTLLTARLISRPGLSPSRSSTEGQ